MFKISHVGKLRPEHNPSALRDPREAISLAVDMARGLGEFRSKLLDSITVVQAHYNYTEDETPSAWKDDLLPLSPPDRALQAALCKQLSDGEITVYDFFMQMCAHLFTAHLSADRMTRFRYQQRVEREALDMIKNRFPCSEAERDLVSAWCMGLSIDSPTDFDRMRHHVSLNFGQD